MKGIIIRLMFCFDFLMTAGGSYIEAYSYSLTDDFAAEKSRVSFIMRSVEGTSYNVYIVGDGDKYAGKSAPFVWGSTNDLIYKATAYTPYISELNDVIALQQDIKLFGDNSRNEEYINVTNPTRTGGVYVIKGINGQPDILVAAIQTTGGGFVDYRFFAIKNGELRQMKLLFSNQNTRLVSMGYVGNGPHALSDGTIALPWFKQKMGGAKDFGQFTSVYMPDYNNLILIWAYTVKGDL